MIDKYQEDLYNNNYSNKSAIKLKMQRRFLVRLDQLALYDRHN